jgi:hypothetical protein
MELTCTHISDSPLNPPEGDLKDVDYKKGVINTQNFENIFLKALFGGLGGWSLEVMMKRIIL